METAASSAPSWSWRRSSSLRSPCSSPRCRATPTVAGGDFYRGQVVFERECASCHGAGGEGGEPRSAARRHRPRRCRGCGGDRAGTRGHAARARVRRGAGGRRRLRRRASAGRKLQSVEIEARIVRLQLAETFVIARDATDHADVVHVALIATRRRPGTGRRRRSSATTSPRVGVEVRRRARRARRRRPVRARGDRRAARGAAGRAGGEGRDRRRAPRSAGKAARTSPLIACSGFRGAARRPRGRCGSATRTTWRGGQRRRRRATGG